MGLLFMSSKLFYYARYVLVHLGFHDDFFRNLCYRYLQGKLKWSERNYVGAPPNNRLSSEGKFIWFLWQQGLDNAPELVKKCYESTIKYKEDYEVILLTKDNLHDYVELPDHVELLYKNKLMSEALYSDMIRLYLLINYGGIWRDATCFQTECYPSYVKESDFFMFSCNLLFNKSKICCSSWFVKSQKRNDILVKTYNILCEYHLHHKMAIDYFLFHLVLTLVVRNDINCKEIWNKMPYVCNMNPHVFYFKWNMDYSERIYNHCFEQCFIHKLSWKYSENEINNKGNMLNYFLENE